MSIACLPTEPRRLPSRSVVHVKRSNSIKTRPNSVDSVVKKNTLSACLSLCLSICMFLCWYVCLCLSSRSFQLQWHVSRTDLISNLLFLSRLSGPTGFRHNHYNLLKWWAVLRFICLRNIPSFLSQIFPNVLRGVWCTTALNVLYWKKNRKADATSLEKQSKDK